MQSELAKAEEWLRSAICDGISFGLLYYPMAALSRTDPLDQPTILQCAYVLLHTTGRHPYFLRYALCADFWLFNHQPQDCFMNVVSCILFYELIRTAGLSGNLLILVLCLNLNTVEKCGQGKLYEPDRNDLSNYKSIDKNVQFRQIVLAYFVIMGYAIIIL
jgi:putative flippase GtrA